MLYSLYLGPFRSCSSWKSCRGTRSSLRKGQTCFQLECKAGLYQPGCEKGAEAQLSGGIFNRSGHKFCFWLFGWERHLLTSTSLSKNYREIMDAVKSVASIGSRISFVVVSTLWCRKRGMCAKRVMVADLGCVLCLTRGMTVHLYNSLLQKRVMTAVLD